MKQKALLDSLGERWSWGEEDLKYTDIEAPAKVKEMLMTRGLYRSVVNLKAAKRRKGELQNMGVLEDGRAVYDLFDDEGETTVALAGEIPMEVPKRWRTKREGASQSQQSQSEPGGSGDGDGDLDGRSGGTREFTEEDLRGVEDQLMRVVQDISDHWSERITQSPLEKAVYDALATPFDWGDEDCALVIQSGGMAYVTGNHYKELKSKLNKIFEHFP